MILRTTLRATSYVRNDLSSPNVLMTYGDKAGDAAIIIAALVFLLILTATGLLTAIFRDDIENLYAVNSEDLDEY